tara:strand:- start:9 stop:1877 length:1869 start_codon:yes stop_codon:yes gene_type:complete
MKNLLAIFIAFNIHISSAVNWANENECKLPDHSEFIDTLVSQMTLEQKVGQIIMPEINSVTPEQAKKYHFGTILNGGGGFPNQNKNSTVEDWKNLSKSYYDVSTEVNGTKIPILWGTDAVHGHNNVIGATIFPHNIALGATQNPELLKRIGSAVAKEVSSTGIIWTFAPTIAVPQNDLWGRTYEGYSEDPKLVSSLGKNFILGLQGEDETFLNNEHILATAKHFLGDGGTDSGIDQGDTKVNEKTLKNIHGLPYYDAIDSCALSIMASFNSWNGLKSHGNKYLLTDILKSQMNFDGFIVGDWNGHGQIEGCEDSNCPEAFNSGVDIFMVPAEWKSLYWNTLNQVRSGEIALERLDDAVKRILRVKKYLGLFDDRLPHDFKENFIGNESHRDIARQAVRESLVLLKNEDSILPLNPTKKFLIVGDQSKNIVNQMGGWTITWQGKTWEGTEISNDDFPNTSSIFDSLSKHITNSGGYVEFSNDGSYVKKPDIVIMIYGETPYAEGEGDIKSLDFSSTNQKIIKSMEILSNKQIPIISLFITGRPLIVDQELNLSDAFVSIWHPGSAVEGINDVIFSTRNNSINYNFKGKLPYSWPSSISSNPLNIGDKKYNPLFEYGYGLSYQE